MGEHLALSLSLLSSPLQGWSPSLKLLLHSDDFPSLSSNCIQLGMMVCFIPEPLPWLGNSGPFRLVTYCLGHANGPLLAASLLFFPLLSWHLELQEGALGYLRTTALSAALSALVYLFLAGLRGVEAQASVSGYLPVHLAQLGCHGRRSGWLSAALLGGLLFGLGEILSPRSPFLLNVSGLLTGLLACNGSNPTDLDPCFLLSQNPCAGGVSIQPGGGGCHPDPAPSSLLDRPKGRPEVPAAFSNNVPAPLPGFPRGFGHTFLLSPKFPNGGRANTSSHPGFSARQERRRSEAAQIFCLFSPVNPRGEIGWAEPSGASILPSSLRPLPRLQQLRKMGFPTEEATIALAATGHVEGAVSLLIGGHVGDQAVVMAETRSAPPPTRPQSIPNP
uniref:Rhomboid domain containing 3 n=1 Tax=Pseudonaja textilis TaxID=8673 RepID=A0A670ZPP4_PSETE